MSDENGIETRVIGEAIAFYGRNGHSYTAALAMQHLGAIKERLTERSAPVEAGTAALEDYDIEECIRIANKNGYPLSANGARIELDRLKRAAAGRDAVIEECAAICDEFAQTTTHNILAAPVRLCADRIRAMQSPPATGRPAAASPTVKEE